MPTARSVVMLPCGDVLDSLRGPCVDHRVITATTDGMARDRNERLGSFGRPRKKKLAPHGRVSQGEHSLLFVATPPEQVRSKKLKP